MTTRFRASRALFVGSVFSVAAACLGDGDSERIAIPPAADGSLTPRQDAAGSDASSRSEGGVDSSVDAGVDATVDATVDAEADASDAGPDGDVDAAGDAADAEPDAADAQADAVIVGCIPQEVSTRYDATWLFGSKCRGDWNGSNVVTFSSTPVTFSGIEGTITASNALTGALFAASDGVDLYDGTGTKTNDASLGANVSAAQPVAFLGKPGSVSDFYIVANASAASGTGTGGLYLSSLECGTVAPVAPPAFITGTENYTEALATVRHANNTDRWILAVAEAGVAVLPVTASGVGAPVVTPWGGALTDLTPQQRTFITFARDRHTFALTAEGVGMLLGDFDRATGAVSGLTPVTLPAHTTLYSAAFSADQTKLYVSEWAGKYWQVDRANANAVVELGASSGALRLAIDDKIYLAGSGASQLGVISNPNQPAAQLTIGSAPLPSGCTSTYGFPGVGDL